jgi:tetratricopeptide (TPR) repeat protein
MGWFWWLRNYRSEADAWLERVVAMAGDPPPEDPAHPLYWPRTDARMLLFFVKSDHATADQLSAPESVATARYLERAYNGSGPQSARFPGMLWPFTSYILGGTIEIRQYTETVVANCRKYGSDWELAVALMFRTHVAVDTPGGLPVADDTRAELAELTERLSDRWVSAQVRSAAGEIAMARGDYRAARAHLEAAHRLGAELGAAAEAAFLLARMGEVAYRAGDDASAERLVREADESCERYSVWDARTYVRYLQAMLLLRRGDVAQARRLCELATGHATDGTPPPVFISLLVALSARITLAEGDPGAALARAAEALRLAQAAGGTEQVVAAQLDTAAEALCAAGGFRSAAVLLAAADAVRGVLPRSLPEREVAAAVAARAAEALPERELAAARERGAALTAQAAAELVAALAGGE